MAATQLRQQQGRPTFSQLVNEFSYASSSKRIHSLLLPIICFIFHAAKNCALYQAERKFNL